MSLRRFELRADSVEKFWEITQTGNRLKLVQGNIGQQGFEIVQDFDSRDSAQLAVDELVKGKIAEGFTEIQVDEIQKNIANISLGTRMSLPAGARRLGKPEHSLAESNEFEIHQLADIELDIFADKSDSSTKKKGSLSLARGLDSRGHFLSLGFNSLSGYESYSVGSPGLFDELARQARIIFYFQSEKDAKKSFEKFLEDPKITDFLKKGEVRLFRESLYLKAHADGLPHLRALCSDWACWNSPKIHMDASAVHAIIESTLTSTAKVKVKKIQQLNLAKATPSQLEAALDRFEQFRERGESANSILGNPILTIPLVELLAEKLVNNLIQDNWAESTASDGQIDYKTLNNEAAMLYYFARSANHLFGYWVQVKRMIKFLEKSGTHIPILAAFYSALETNYEKKRFVLFDEIGLSEISPDASAHFGSLGPRPATYRYMLRRGRRHVNWLLHNEPQKYARLATYMLRNSAVDKGFQYGDVENARWITYSIMYSQVWKDDGHGKSVKLPEHTDLDSTLHISEIERAYLARHEEVLQNLVNTSNFLDIATFAYQILDASDIEVAIPSDRYDFFLQSTNPKIQEIVFKSAKTNLAGFIETVGTRFEIFARFVNFEEDATHDLIIEILRSTSSDTYSYLRSGVSDILAAMLDRNSDKAFTILDNIQGHKHFRSSAITEAFFIKVLFGFPERLDVFLPSIRQSFTETNGNLWVTHLLAMPESNLTLDFFDVAMPYLQGLGNSISINQLKNLRSWSTLSRFIEHIEGAERLDNVAKAFIAYADNFVNETAKETVSAVVMTYVRSQDDFVNVIKWSWDLEKFYVVTSLQDVDSDVVPWHLALRVQMQEYLNEPSFISKCLAKDVPANGLLELAIALDAQVAINQLLESAQQRSAIAQAVTLETFKNLTDELTRVLIACKDEMFEITKNDAQLTYAFATSTSSELQHIGCEFAREHDQIAHLWLRLIESQLPLPENIARDFVSALVGEQLNDAVLLCLDSPVVYVRNFGLELLASRASELNVDDIYVKLCEHHDPYIAALLAARAIEPDFPDDLALDNFDQRQLLSIRQGRKAKELVKSRRLAAVVGGSELSTDFITVLDQVANFGPQIDSDWAFEMLSYIQQSGGSK